jgi:uncharacterized protein (DUF1697 family)
MPKTARYIALLRGINVGGKNMVPMADLADAFAKAGCLDVRTYIQSGNVVFAADAATAERVPVLVPERIGRKLGFRPPVVLRTAAEFRRVTEGNPYLSDDADLRLLYVMFLAGSPGRRRAAGLDPDRSPGDSFEFRGREIYLRLGTGAAKTRLTNAYFDSTLETVSTSRNWRTVLTLAEMARD